MKKVFEVFKYQITALFLSVQILNSLNTFIIQHFLHLCFQICLKPRFLIFHIIMKILKVRTNTFVYSILFKIFYWNFFDALTVWFLVFLHDFIDSFEINQMGVLTDFYILLTSKIFIFWLFFSLFLSDIFFEKRKRFEPFNLKKTKNK